jgi:uncharacterized protein YdaU (DUF1376 family)
MNFYKFHLGDYYKKTSHLTMLEDGAYRRLIDAIYLREGPLPANREQVYRLVKASSKAEKTAIDSVLSEFFTLTDAGYTNARCDEELDAVRAKSAKASQSAGRRWSNANADAMAMRTHSDGNASHKPVTKTSSSTEPPERFPPARETSQPPASAPVTNRHRIVAADLIDRGKAELSAWERRFLEDLCGRSTISAKMQTTLDGIAAKIGLNVNDVMATWRHRLNVARKLRQWDPKWGAAPGSIGCLAPDELLEPNDGNGWTEWRPAC